MSDIVERLRALPEKLRRNKRAPVLLNDYITLIQAAADEIERLRKAYMALLDEQLAKRDIII